MESPPFSNSGELSAFPKPDPVNVGLRPKEIGSDQTQKNRPSFPAQHKETFPKAEILGKPPYFWVFQGTPLWLCSFEIIVFLGLSVRILFFFGYAYFFKEEKTPEQPVNQRLRTKGCEPKVRWGY
jgi:hypothetical protein